MRVAYVLLGLSLTGPLLADGQEKLSMEVKRPLPFNEPSEDPWPECRLIRPTLERLLILNYPAKFVGWNRREIQPAHDRKTCLVVITAKIQPRPGYKGYMLYYFDIVRGRR
jgi:hypothetical protein